MSRGRKNRTARAATCWLYFKWKTKGGKTFERTYNDQDMRLLRAMRARREVAIEVMNGLSQGDMKDFAQMEVFACGEGRIPESQDVF